MCQIANSTNKSFAAGMVMYDDLTNLAVADLPGLIAGASKWETDN